MLTHDKNRAVVMLKLTTDKHEASSGLSATAELLVCTEPLKPIVLHTPLSICHYYITLLRFVFMPPPSYARLRLYVPMFRANIGISFDSHDY